MERNILFYSDQYGFRQGHSTELASGSFHVRSPKKMKFETAPPQILIKLYTLPLCDYNRRPVIF